MSGIRVSYSGLISFAIGIVSVFTGIIFTLIVTRQLTPDEFGTWSLIGSLIVYVIIIEPIISYWVTREVARGVDSAKTAVFTSGIFSTGGIMGYIIIAYFVGLATDADQNILLFASILVPLMFLNKTLTAINLGWKPVIVSYGFLTIEITKIPAALILVYFFEMSIIGAIIATAVAYVASIIVLGIYARNKLKVKIKKMFLKKWFKLSWLPIYPGIASLIFVLDVTVFAVITGSIEGVAFWAAAVAIAGLTIHARSISNAIYPKLLEGGKSEHVQENLSLLFYFAIPLVAISITFARPGLFALNPLYDVAFLVVIFLAIRAFLNNLSNLFILSLKGIEKVDVNENSTFIEYIKSKLFLVPTIQLIQYSLYIGLLIVVLLLSKHFSSQLELVIYWSVISLATQLPFTLYFYKLGRKSFEIKVNHFNIFKYFIISVGVFGSTYLLMEEFLIYQESIFNFLPDVMLFLALSIGSYLVITYLVDSKTRKLFNAIIQEIKSKNTNS